MTVKEIIIQFLSESPPATLSFGRGITVFIVAFVLGWDTASVVHAIHFNWAHPATAVAVLPDAASLAAQGIFMTLFYGANKLAGVYGSSKTADGGK